MNPVSNLPTVLRYSFVALALSLGLAATASATASEPTDPTGTTARVQADTPMSCALNFADVPPTDEFHPYVMCLACQGIIGGYACGAADEPCNENNDPYFRPNLPVTRGQISKIVALSAGFVEPVPADRQTFSDVVYGSTFWEYVERLASRGVMDGYACGGDTEPCDSLNRPYFRPFENTNRGQLMKIVNKAGRTEGASTGESSSGAYAGLDGLITRAETSKVVSNAFFPNCSP